MGWNIVGKYCSYHGYQLIFNFLPSFLFPLSAQEVLIQGLASCSVTLYKYNGLKNIAKEEENKLGPTLEFCKHDKQIRK